MLEVAANMIKARKFQRYFRALHCPTRWEIIRIIGEDEKGSGEILEGLRNVGEGLARSSLYYHLSELEEAGALSPGTDKSRAIDGAINTAAYWNLVARSGIGSTDYELVELTPE